MYTGYAVFLGLLAQPALIWAAPTFGVVVADTDGLSREAIGLGQKINEVNLATGAINAKNIAGDIDAVTADVASVQADNKGTKPQNDDADEEQLSDAFNLFGENFSEDLDALREKASDLNELGQGGPILTSLQNFGAQLKKFSPFLEGLEGDDDEKDVIADVAAGVMSDLTNTEDAYQALAV